MKSRCVLALLAASFAAGASAQTLKPGLWEVTSNMKSGSAEMDKARAQAQQQMANMPPEQRRMMEEMMAKHGMQMGSMGPAGMSARICLTKDMVERNEIPAQQGDCKMGKQQRSGNTIKYAFTCANPPSSGEGQYTFVSPEAYTFRTTFKTGVHGKTETMSTEGSGKWIQTDCGSLKPMGRPGAK